MIRSGAQRCAAGAALAVALASALAAAGARAGEPSARDAGAILSRRPVTLLSSGGGDGADRPATLGGYFGQVTVVNFWASWCRPCRKELPELAAWGGRWADRGVVTLLVSVDEEPQRAERFVRETRVALPAFCDGPEGLAKQLDLPSLPCTFVVDGRGEATLIGGRGGNASLADLDRAVTTRLAEAVPAAVPSQAGER